MQLIGPDMDAAISQLSSSQKVSPGKVLVNPVPATLITRRHILNQMPQTPNTLELTQVMGHP